MTDQPDIPERSHTLIIEGTIVVVRMQHDVLGYITVPGCVRFPLNQELTRYHVDAMILPEGDFEPNQPGIRYKPTIMCLNVNLEDIAVVGDARITKMDSNSAVSMTFDRLIKDQIEQVKNDSPLEFIRERIMEALMVKANMVGIIMTVDLDRHLRDLCMVMLKLGVMNMAVDPVAVAHNTLNAMLSVVDHQSASQHAIREDIVHGITRED